MEDQNRPCIVNSEQQLSPQNKPAWYAEPSQNPSVSFECDVITFFAPVAVVGGGLQSAVFKPSPSIKCTYLVIKRRIITKTSPCCKDRPIYHEIFV